MRPSSILSPLILHRWVVGFFAALARISIAHPFQTIALALAVTLAMAPGIFRLRLLTDGKALVAENVPEVVFDRSIRAAFGLEDPLVILVKAPSTNGIFRTDVLRYVRQLTDALARIPQVRSNSIVSLATSTGFRLRPNSLQYKTLLENCCETPEDLAQLRGDLRQIGLYTGTLVARDEQSTAILLGVPANADRASFLHEVQAVLMTQHLPHIEVSITGSPVAESLLGIHLLQDLGVPPKWMGIPAERPAIAPSSNSSLKTWQRSLAAVVTSIGLAPLTAILMFGVFWISFRRVLAAVLPLFEVGACLLFLFGVMGWLNIPIYLTITVMPIILIATAVTDEIHVYSRYFALLRERPEMPPTQRVETTLDEMVCPVVNTSLTTAIGFLSFAFSPLKPVVAFGLLTCVGVLFCLVWSLSVMPALLTVIPAHWLRPNDKRFVTSIHGLFSPQTYGRLAGTVAQHQTLILAALAVLLSVLPLGWKRLKVQDGWIQNFSPQSAFAHAAQDINEQFHGMHLLQVWMDGSQMIQGRLSAGDRTENRFIFPESVHPNPNEWVGRWLSLSPIRNANERDEVPWRSMIQDVQRIGGRWVVTTESRDLTGPTWERIQSCQQFEFRVIAQPFLQPSTIEAVAAFEESIKKRSDLQVGGVLGAPDYLSTTRFMVHPEEPNSRRIPDTPVDTKMMWDLYRAVRGEEQSRQVVDTYFARSLVTIFLKRANFEDTEKLMKEVQNSAQKILEPVGIRIGFAGDVAVSQSLIGGIVRTQMQSLVGSLVGIFLVTAVLGRSLRWGLYAMVPCTLAVGINFAVMGWADIPLGVATSMFAGMTMGIGVDFAIHMLETYSREREAGHSSDSALASALAHTGPAVLINTVAIALGFGVLMLSQVPANAHLGALLVLGMLDSLLATVLVLPWILHRWPLPVPSRQD